MKQIAIVIYKSLFSRLVSQKPVKILFVTEGISWYSVDSILLYYSTIFINMLWDMDNISFPIFITEVITSKRDHWSHINWVNDNSFVDEWAYTNSNFKKTLVSTSVSDNIDLVDHIWLRKLKHAVETSSNSCEEWDRWPKIDSHVWHVGIDS